MAVTVCHVHNHSRPTPRIISAGVLMLTRHPSARQVVNRLAIVDQLLNGMWQVVLAVGDRLDLLNRRGKMLGVKSYIPAQVWSSGYLRPLLDQADAVAVHADHGVLAMITALRTRQGRFRLIAFSGLPPGVGGR